jgi:hypothetical protein
MNLNELAQRLYEAHQHRGEEVDRDITGDWLAVAHAAQAILQPTVIFACKAESGIEVWYSDGRVEIMKAPANAPVPA